MSEALSASRTTPTDVAASLAVAQHENAQLRAELDRVNAEGRRVVAALEEQKRTAAAAASASAAAALKTKLKAPQMQQFKGEIGSAVEIRQSHTNNKS
jgi:hypothetical protein